MDRHLILYHSNNGQTEKICHTIFQTMKSQQLSCCLKNFTKADDHFNVFDYSSILFAMPVRYGKHNKAMVQFITTYKQQLSSIVTGIISVNLTARKADKNTPETNPYINKLLKTLNWQPTYKAVIAGALKYPDYVWYDRIMIRLIMKMTKGPTDTSLYTEFTDWENVVHIANDYSHILIKNKESVG